VAKSYNALVGGANLAVEIEGPARNRVSSDLRKGGLRQSKGTVIKTVGFVKRRVWRSAREAVARLSFAAGVGALLYSIGVTALTWYAASQRAVEVIEPWRHHWDLIFWLSESSTKLAWAAVAALLSVVVRPSRANLALLLLCVLLWLVHFGVHIGLVS
jgi:hypothetical protein